MEIVFEQLPGLLVELRMRSGLLLRSQRVSPLGLIDVALDRGEAHGEGAGRLGPGDTASYGGDYPSSEVHRVTAHATMFSSVHYHCNTLSQVTLPCSRDS